MRKDHKDKTIHMVQKKAIPNRGNQKVKLLEPLITTDTSLRVFFFFFFFLIKMVTQTRPSL